MNCLAHWGLRTNPLAPERAIEGQVVRFKYGDNRLEPLITASHLEFYFDLYAWQDLDRLKGICTDGPFEVFNLQDSEMVTVVLSGAKGCGRSSLKNLLLYELKQRAPNQKTPMIAECPLPATTDPQQIATTLAVELYKAFKVAGGDPAELRAVVKELREDHGDTPVPADQLLRVLRTRMDELLPNVPIVFSLDSRSSTLTRDMAKAACETLKPLAHYTILSMTDAKAAGHVRGYLSQNQAPSAWVDSPQLNKAALEAFLLERLRAERQGAPPPTPLHPFTPAALDELFEPNDDGSRDSVSFPMRVVLQEVGELIEHKCQAWGGAAQGSPFEITAQDVRDLRERKQP